jgi:CIC family chloride channel protein
MTTTTAERGRSDPRKWVEQVRFALAVVLVALAAAGFAIVLRGGVAFVLERVWHAEDIVTLMRSSPLWLRVLLPTLGGLLAGLIGVVVARSPQGGVGDVMEAVVLGQVRLSMRHTLLKSLASFIAIVSGGSLGREGPLIQFGGAIGKLVASMLHLSLRDVRRVIAVGTAAGFAAAYNTPFAAVLFVLEVVIGVFVLDTIVPTLIGTVIAAELTRLVVGAGPIYGERTFVHGESSELLGYALLGVLTALVAKGFMRLLAVTETVARRVALPWRAALGGLLCGACIALLPEVAGNGYEPLDELLDARFTAHFAVGLLVIKCFATAASVGTGSPGGVFTPTLLIGGALGFAYGSYMHDVLPGVSAPAASYALVGMAASTAATCHAPLLAAVMVFELSRDYGIVLPLALSTGLAAAVANALGRDSIYAAELRSRGIGWALTLEGRALERASRRSEPGPDFRA